VYSFFLGATRLDRGQEVLQREAHELVTTAVGTVGELVAEDDEPLLVGGQPPVLLLGISLDPVEGERSQADGDESLEDVDPAPAAVAPVAVQLANAVSEETGNAPRAGCQLAARASVNQAAHLVPAM
jgi:hypothetical protein